MHEAQLRTTPTKSTRIEIHGRARSTPSTPSKEAVHANT